MYYAPINVKPAGGGGGGAKGGILIDRFGPGVGHLNYLALQLQFQNIYAST